MKTFKYIHLILIAGFTAVLIFVSCSDDTTGINDSSEGSSSINEYFNSIPDWEISEIDTLIESYQDTITVTGPDTSEADFENAPMADYRCPVFDREMTTTIRNFTSVGTNEGKVWPGAIIQGNSLKTGDIQLIQTDGKRADITLTTNIPLEEGSKTITPNSVTAQQAVSDFMIAAGGMPEGSQAGAGVTYFRVEEATTFNQSMSQMGISAGFTDPQSQVGMDGSLEVSKERSSYTHTVAAQYVQEKFKIRIADDLISTPADFFTDDFTTDDLEQLEQNGEIGTDNIPLYIEEVTYGRILLFSKTSDRVAKSSDLTVALEASMADYASAGGGISQEQEEILTNSTNRIYSAGGSEAGANAAVRNLAWSDFFVETSASEAVPISFVARTINGKKVVGVINQESYEYRDDCSIVEFIEPPAPEVESYDVTVEWTETNNTGACFGGGSFGSCSPAGYVNVHRDWGFVRLVATNSYRQVFTIYPEENPEITIRSTSMLKTYVGPVIVTPTLKTMLNTYDITTLNGGSLNGGNTTVRHKMTNFAGSTELVYRIRKVVNLKD